MSPSPIGRPRAFDEEKVLDAVFHVFWQKGFDGTSTEDLCKASGLNRSSLYNSFHSKEALFRLVLARYMKQMASQQEKLLASKNSTMDNIRALLSAIIGQEVQARASGNGGCFTVNSITALCMKNPEIADMLKQDFQQRLNVLSSVLEQGQEDGSINKNKNAADMACLVCALIAGMRVSAQAGATEAQLAAIAETGLTGIEGARPD